MVRWLTTAAGQVLSLRRDQRALASLATLGELVGSGQLSLQAIAPGASDLVGLLSLANRDQQLQHALLRHLQTLGVTLLGDALNQSEALADALRLVKQLRDLAPRLPDRSDLGILACTWRQVDAESCPERDISWSGLDDVESDGSVAQSQLSFALSGSLDRALTFQARISDVGDFPESFTGSSRLRLTGSLAADASLGFPLCFGKVDPNADSLAQLRLDWLAARRDDIQVAATAAATLSEVVRTNPFDLGDLHHAFQRGRLRAIAMDADGAFGISGSLAVGVTETLFGKGSAIAGIEASLSVELGFHTSRDGRYRLSVYPAEHPDKDQMGVRVDIHRTDNSKESTNAAFGLTLDLSRALEGLRGDLIRHGEKAADLLKDLEDFIPPSAAIRSQLEQQVKNRVQDMDLLAVLESVLGTSDEASATRRLSQRLAAELDARADLWTGKPDTIADEVTDKVLDSLQLDDASTGLLKLLLTETARRSTRTLRTRLQDEVKQQLADSGATKALEKHLEAAEYALDSGLDRVDDLSRRVQFQLDRFQGTLSRMVKALQQSSEIKMRARWYASQERARGSTVDQSLLFLPQDSRAAGLYQRAITGSLDDLFKELAGNAGGFDDSVVLLSGTLQEVASLRRESGFELTLLDFQLGGTSLLDSEVVVETDASGSVRVCTKATSRWRMWRPGQSIEVETVNAFELATAKRTRHMSLSASLTQVDKDLQRSGVEEFFGGLAKGGIGLITNAQLEQLTDQLPSERKLGEGELRAWLDLAEPQLMALLRIGDPRLGLQGNRLSATEERLIFNTAIDAMVAGLWTTGSKTNRNNLAHWVGVDNDPEAFARELKTLRSSNLRARHGVDSTSDGAATDQPIFDHLERIIKRAEGMVDLIRDMRYLYFSNPGPGWSIEDYQKTQKRIDDVVRLWVKGELADRGLIRLFRGANDIGPYLLAYFKTLAELCRPEQNPGRGARVQASIVFPGGDGPSEILLVREEPEPLPAVSASIAAGDTETKPRISRRSDSMAKLIFPLEKRIRTYHTGGRRYGSNRSKGRLHAGCDLTVPPGTRIYAMAKGRVVRGPYAFYSGTYALEVEHEAEDGSSILVRYGEIKRHVPNGIAANQDVERGQVIAQVGRLNSGSSMLHLEMYENGYDHSKLTVGGNPYKRRADVMNPTDILDKAPTLSEVEAAAGAEDGGGQGNAGVGGSDATGTRPSGGATTRKVYEGKVNERVANRLNLRKSAIVDRTLTPVARLSRGTKLEVLEAVNGGPYPYGLGNLWFRVRPRDTPGAEEGYVMAYFVDTDYPVSGATGLDGVGKDGGAYSSGFISRLTGGLNIRSEASVNSRVRATLPLGTEVKVLDQVSGGSYGSGRTDWLYVEYNTDDVPPLKDKGYAAAFYIDIGVKNETGHDPTKAPKDDLNLWERVLLDTNWAGCSEQTARSELPGMNLSGAAASERIAAKDVESVRRMAGVFHDVAAKFGIPAAVLAGIASRESHVGGILKDGRGDYGNGFGVMQVDIRSHTIRGTDPHGRDHVEQAAGIYDRFLQKMLTLDRFKGWEDKYRLLGATAAYNFGVDDVRTKERIDIGTSHDDYGSDTLARAKFFFKHADLHELRD